MTKIITFYELLTMMKNGTAPRKIYVLASGKKHYYERQCENDYYATDGEEPLMSLISKHELTLGAFLKREYVHYEEPVLNEVEKKYLETALRPFRKRIISIEKTALLNNKCYLRVMLDNMLGDIMTFPYFKQGEMYNGMEYDKQYSLKELGLYEE